jgi:hypothetical protein
MAIRPYMQIGCREIELIAWVITCWGSAKIMLNKNKKHKVKLKDFVTTGHQAAENRKD